MAYDKYRVEHNGEVTYINNKLVERRGIDDETLEKIKQSHVERIALFQQARATTDATTLRALAESFEQLEFRQQELWGFPRDATMHRWFDFPGCTCPKMDNIDSMGTTYKTYDFDCPIHGGGWFKE